MNTTVRRRKTFITLAAATATLITLAACGNDTEPTTSADPTNGAGTDGPQETVSIQFGTGNWVGYGPWHIAEAEGYFADNGIEVEQTVFGASDRIAAFASGNLDVANFAVHSAYLLYQQGVDFKLVGLLDYSLEADGVLAGPGIDTPADLAGLDVAYEPASASEIMMAATLEQGGLTLEDVNAVPLSAADAATAVVAGSVSAAVTYEPYISPAIANDPSLSTIFTGADMPGIVSDIVVVRQEFIDEHPEAVEGLLAAWDSSIEFFRADEVAGRELIAEGVGAASPDDLEFAFDGVVFFNGPEMAEELTTGEYRQDVMPMMLRRAADAGIIEEDADIDLDDLVDPSFASAIA